MPKAIPSFATGDGLWAIAETLMHAGKHTVLWGPPGVGKSYLAQARGGYTVACHDQLQVSDVIGHVWPGDTWTWKHGPATRAMIEGVPLILNELGRCNAEVREVLLAVCDSRESAKLSLPTGETVAPAPGFVAIATSNTDPDEDLDPALRNRFTSLRLTHPHPGIIARIAAQSPELAVYVARSYTAGQNQISCRACFDFLDLRKLFDDNVAAQLAFGTRGLDIVAMLPVASEAR